MRSTNFCSIPAKARSRKMFFAPSYQKTTDPFYRQPGGAAGACRPFFSGGPAAAQRRAMLAHSSGHEEAAQPRRHSPPRPRSISAPALACGPGSRSAPRRPAHSHGPVAEALEDGERGAVAALQEERVDGAEQRRRRSGAARHGAARHSAALGALASGGRGRARSAHGPPGLSVNALRQQAATSRSPSRAGSQRLPPGRGRLRARHGRPRGVSRGAPDPRRSAGCRDAVGAFPGAMLKLHRALRERRRSRPAAPCRAPPGESGSLPGSAPPRAPLPARARAACGGRPLAAGGAAPPSASPPSSLHARSGCRVAAAPVPRWRRRSSRRWKVTAVPLPSDPAPGSRGSRPPPSHPIPADGRCERPRAAAAGAGARPGPSVTSAPPGCRGIAVPVVLGAARRSPPRAVPFRGLSLPPASWAPLQLAASGGRSRPCTTRPLPSRVPAFWGLPITSLSFAYWDSDVR